MILMSILTISHFGASYALSFYTFSFRIGLINKNIIHEVSPLR